MNKCSDSHSTGFSKITTEIIVSIIYIIYSETQFKVSFGRSEFEHQAKENLKWN
jgi:hypothetical protein